MKWSQSLHRFRDECGSYTLLPSSLEEYANPHCFWGLPTLLQDPPSLRLPRGGSHRWGALTVVYKHKSMILIKTEGFTWSMLKVRPLVSYARHRYRKWLQLACRGLNFLSSEILTNGNGMMSSARVLKHISGWNANQTRYHHDTVPPMVHGPHLPDPPPSDSASNSNSNSNDSDAPDPPLGFFSLFVADIDGCYNNINRESFLAELREVIEKAKSRRRKYI